MTREEKHRAYELYVEEKHSMQAIAQKLNIHYNTIRNWAKEGNWREAQISRTSRPARLSTYYLQQCCNMLASMDAANCKITMNELDIITKLITSADQLDRDIHIGMQAYALKKFGYHLVNDNLAFGNQFNKYKAQFIRDMINTDQRDIPALMPHINGSDNLFAESDIQPTQK